MLDSITDDITMVGGRIVDGLGWDDTRRRAMSTLERAIALAATVHAGQKDKAGAAYILHPLRMMMKMKTPGTQMDLSRIAHPSTKDHARLEKYRAAKRVIEAAIANAGLAT
jgi:(p)ppGpp synthase/HD superfamily hydrolase